VDAKGEIREFLTSRRGRLTPAQVGLTSYGPRRVPGLRREEVAVLAGVSVPYYTRLERGNLSGVSESVLEALGRALQLDEAERAHLFDLARAAQPATPRRRRRKQQQVRPSVQRLIEAMTGAPALVQNGRARFVFLSPRAPDFYRDWDRAANDTVAILRTEAGRDPYDRDLSDLVGELSTQSEEFRTRWAAHNVRIHRTGGKDLHHPVVGDLSLTYEMLEVAADSGLAIVTYTAEPGSRSAEALDLLASWTATIDETDAAETPEHA
jgi:transcriptional regulator with XRE-family HTH domain